jgi:guanidinopropionase
LTGIRGSISYIEEEDWALEQGVRVIRIEELDNLGITGVLGEIHRIVGEFATLVTGQFKC